MASQTAIGIRRELIATLLGCGEVAPTAVAIAEAFRTAWQRQRADIVASLQAAHDGALEGSDLDEAVDAYCAHDEHAAITRAHAETSVRTLRRDIAELFAETGGDAVSELTALALTKASSLIASPDLAHVTAGLKAASNIAKAAQSRREHEQRLALKALAICAQYGGERGERIAERAALSAMPILGLAADVPVSLPDAENHPGIPDRLP